MVVFAIGFRADAIISVAGGSFVEKFIMQVVEGGCGIRGVGYACGMRVWDMGCGMYLRACCGKCFAHGSSFGGQNLARSSDCPHD